MVLEDTGKMTEHLVRATRSKARAAGCALSPGKGDGHERLDVWHAISRLWLQQELGEHELRAIARTLANTPFDWAEIERICVYEVAPVVRGNLRRDGGVWGSFDVAWLLSAIEQNMRNPHYRQEALRKREYMMELVIRDWERVKRLVREIRFGRRLTAEEQDAITRLLQEAEEH